MFVRKGNGGSFILDFQDRQGAPLFVCKLNIRIIVVGNAEGSADLPIAPENHHTLEVADIRGRERNSDAVLSVVECQCCP